MEARYKYTAFGAVSAYSVENGPWQAGPIDFATLPPELSTHMLAGGKKQYYLDPETELYLLGSGTNGRYYDPTTARFLNEDPIRQEAGDPNLYRYVRNDPVNHLDPSGHEDQRKKEKDEELKSPPTSNDHPTARPSETQAKPTNGQSNAPSVGETTDENPKMPAAGEPPSSRTSTETEDGNPSSKGNPPTDGSGAKKDSSNDEGKKTSNPTEEKKPDPTPILSQSVVRYKGKTYYVINGRAYERKPLKVRATLPELFGSPRPTEGDDGQKKLDDAIDDFNRSNNTQVYHPSWTSYESASKKGESGEAVYLVPGKEDEAATTAIAGGMGERNAMSENDLELPKAPQTPATRSGMAGSNEGSTPMTQPAKSPGQTPPDAASTPAVPGTATGPGGESAGAGSPDAKTPGADQKDKSESGGKNKDANPGGKSNATQPSGGGNGRAGGKNGMPPGMIPGPALPPPRPNPGALPNQAGSPPGTAPSGTPFVPGTVGGNPNGTAGPGDAPPGTARGPAAQSGAPGGSGASNAAKKGSGSTWLGIGEGLIELSKGAIIFLTAVVLAMAIFEAPALLVATVIGAIMLVLATAGGIVSRRRLNQPWSQSLLGGVLDAIGVSAIGRLFKRDIATGEPVDESDEEWGRDVVVGPATLILTILGIRSGVKGVRSGWGGELPTSGIEPKSNAEAAGDLEAAVENKGPRGAHKNAHLAGTKHPKTSVPFSSDGHPAFDSLFDTELPPELIGPKVSDTAQMEYATAQLRKMLDIPGAESKFTPEQVSAIRRGDARIPDLTWDHDADGVTLKLVNAKTHSDTGHAGGRATTGGRPGSAKNNGASR